MGDAGDVWASVRAKSQREKAIRSDRNMQQLRDAIYADSRIGMHDTGHGYIISFRTRRILYFPQTGIAVPRYGKDRSRQTLTGNQLVAFITAK